MGILLGVVFYPFRLALGMVLGAFKLALSLTILAALVVVGVYTYMWLTGVV